MIDLTLISTFGNVTLDESVETDLPPTGIAKIGIAKTASTCEIVQYII